MTLARRELPEGPLDHSAGSTLFPRDGLYAWYVLTIITLTYAVSYVDRQMLSLLVGPIKKSLSISDVQFSIVQGSAFVIAYIIASPIFGRLVDVWDRRAILIIGICAWSGCTVLGGFARNYVELFLTRVGIGFAEACVFPVGLSLIGDYFSARKMARAMSTFTLGSQLGSGFSLVCSGLVIAFAASLTHAAPLLRGLQTWQIVLVVIGSPGFFFALIVLTVREPRKRRRPADQTSPGDQPPLNVTPRMPFDQVRAVFVARRGFYIRIYGAIAAMASVSLGQAAWYPAFLMRVHGLDATSTGLRFGISAVVLSTLGNASGPFVGAWLQRRGYTDAFLRASAFSSIGMFIGAVTIPLWTGPQAAFVSAWLILFFSSFPLGLLAGATQNATPPGMRGVVGSIYTFVAQIFGSMLAPLFIALINDHVFHDEMMIGYSMQIVLGIASIAAGYAMFTCLKFYAAIMSEDGVYQ